MLSVPKHTEHTSIEGVLAPDAIRTAFAFVSYATYTKTGACSIDESDRIALIAPSIYLGHSKPEIIAMFSELYPDEAVTDAMVTLRKFTSNPSKELLWERVGDGFRLSKHFEEHVKSQSVPSTQQFADEIARSVASASQLDDPHSG